MSIEIKNKNELEQPVAVKVVRPSWQEFIVY